MLVCRITIVKLVTDPETPVDKLDVNVIERAGSTTTKVTVKNEGVVEIGCQDKNTVPGE